MKRYTAALALAAALASAPAGMAYAQQAYGTAINLDLARKCIAAAEAEATKNNWNMVISIVDDGGNLVALARLDNTQIASIRISIAKARAANNFRRPTKVFQDRAATDVAVLSLPGAIASEGGLPLVLDGKIIGAIGSSGGTSAQDGQVSKACAENIGKL
jgi:glc operon protein GlcG